MAGEARLSTVVIAFESEETARRRLEAFGYAADVAAEIAVYLAQSTDLPLYSGEIAEALGEDGLRANSSRSTNLLGVASRASLPAAKRRSSGR